MRIFLIFIIILLPVGIIGCQKETEKSEQVSINHQIIISKEFQVNSDSTDLNTSVKGTIFLSGEESAVERAQIVAMINIDPEDWGGVMFSIHKNWNISSFTSSYPEDENEENPEDYVSVWTTTEETRHGHNKMIEIGRGHQRWTPTGGGGGTVVIELVRNKESIPTSDVFSLTVGVGSEESDGIKSAHPDWKMIEIPIPH
ncbi:hypothetical protein GCM10008967_37780 [Bacillus carboniphilus]|uniref:Lipoprotein n=1 Tax=Bacillus carboniphilus TaxID=86663 RepID=A0ABN0WPZ0_9BACI